MVQIYTGNSGGQRRAGPITALLFVIVGLGLSWGAYYFGMKTQDLLSHGLHAQGQVVDIKEKMSTSASSGRRSASSSHMMYYPIVKFDDNQHRSVTFTHKVGSSSPRQNKGDTVEVIYMENDPQGTAIINDGALNWLAPGVLGGLGAIFTLVGAFTFMRALAI